MKLPPHTLTAVLALAIFAIAVSPCVAGDEPKTADAKVPVIRVIIDHENHLALVPEGTVLPPGLRIFSSLGQDPEVIKEPESTQTVARPLVFSYAPAERFAGFPVVGAPRTGPGDVIVLDPSIPPEVATTSGGNPCPADFVVELGPGVFQVATCSYKYDNLGRRTEEFRGHVVYPTSAIRTRLWTILHLSYGDHTTETTCYPWAGECDNLPATFVLPCPNATWESRTSIRLPGACTQDPPFCPTYSNSIVLPVMAQ